MVVVPEILGNGSLSFCQTKRWWLGRLSISGVLNSQPVHKEAMKKRYKRANMIKVNTRMAFSFPF
jgi:hypothetical protein